MLESSLVVADVVCGPLSTSLSVSSITHALIAKQSYLPGLANVGSVLPKHDSAVPGCQVHTYEVLSSSSLSTCVAEKYKIKKTSLGTAYTDVNDHQCQSQEAGGAQVGATATGKTPDTCATYCKGLGAAAFRMQTTTCYCLDHQCSTIMLNKIKGSASNNWTTYRFYCSSPNIYSAKFVTASNIYPSETTSVTRTATMIDSANFVGANNALVQATLSASIYAELSDINTARTETFYIYSRADGGSALM